MTIRVGLAGYDRVGRCVARGVAAQADMTLVAVHDSDGQRRATAAKRWPTVDDLGGLAQHCDILINCGEGAKAGGPVVHGPNAVRLPRPCLTMLSESADVRGHPEVQAPCADVIAFARLLHALRPLGPVARFFASTFLRAGHAADAGTGCVDALEPVFDDPAAAWDLEHAIGPAVGECHIRQVRGPYTHSDFHMIKIDLLSPASIEDVRALLGRAPRVIILAARDGFGDTAQVQEFYRDAGRGTPNRHAVAVWEESIAVEGDSLMLMADVCQETTPVPEIIDAVRLNQREDINMAESVARTDQALGVRTRWRELGTRGR